MYQHPESFEQLIEVGHEPISLAARRPEQQIAWSCEPALLPPITLARHLARSGRASLMVPDAAAAELRVVAASGVPRDVVKGVRVRIGEPVAGLVAQTQRPLLVNGEHRLTRAVARRETRYRSRSFISVPVPLDGGRCGVLSVADPVGRAEFHAEDLDGLQQLAELVATRMLPTFARQRLAQLEEANAHLHRELIRVQESERSRLARDLHDEAGHALTLALFQLDLERVKPTTPPGAKETLTQARDAILGCATALNEMAFRLRPRILEDLGLIPALRTLVTQAQQPGGPQITLVIKDEAVRPNEEVELAVFRVVQEALTNTRKHAQASLAWVHLAAGTARRLQVMVQDNGVGVDAAEALSGGHAGQGLRGMRERVEALGGTFAIGRRRGGGTRLNVTLPLRTPGAGHDRR